MDVLRDFLNQHIALSNADWVAISERFKPETFNKNETLTKAGQTEGRMYFIVRGVVRLYYELDHKDITLNFAFPNAFVNAYTSFLTQEPSDFFLEALTNCELLSIAKEDLYALYDHTSCGHALGRIFTEKLFLYLSKRENDFMIKTPTQRYLDLFDQQPHLINEIPQKYLASYIGITPQALSRIRAKI